MSGGVATQHLAHERGPPILLRRAVGPSIEHVGGGGAQFPAALDCVIAAQAQFGQQPLAANVYMQHFVSPVKVLNLRRKRVVGVAADLVLETLACGRGHEVLLNRVEHGVRIGGRERAQAYRHTRMDGNQPLPVHASALEIDCTEHGMAHFVPQLARHLHVVRPRQAASLIAGAGMGDDACHVLGHIHLHNTAAHERQRALVQGDCLVERNLPLRIDKAPAQRKALVALREEVGDKGRLDARGRRRSAFGFASNAARGHKPSVQVLHKAIGAPCIVGAHSLECGGAPDGFVFRIHNDVAEDVARG